MRSKTPLAENRLDMKHDDDNKRLFFFFFRTDVLVTPVVSDQNRGVKQVQAAAVPAGGAEAPRQRLTQKFGVFLPVEPNCRTRRAQMRHCPFVTSQAAVSRRILK